MARSISVQIGETPPGTVQIQITGDSDAGGRLRYTVTMGDSLATARLVEVE